MRSQYSRTLAAVLTLLAFTATPSFATPIMFGGLGGHNNGDSTNDGALAIVNQTTGAASIVGHPAGVSRISGLAFDLGGTLFGTTQPGGGFPPPPGPVGASNLIRLDPLTAALLSSVPITDGGLGISIADLAVQPGTNVLYGIRGPSDQLGGQGGLYTINPVNGVATFVGNTGDFFGSIAFAPNGTLFMASADLDPVTDNLINVGLKRLNPANAATLSFVATTDFFGALAVRPTDGAIFGDNGDLAQLFTINSITGAETLVGNTGRNFIGDLAFQPEAVPEPSTVGLVGLGLASIVQRLRNQRLRRRGGRGRDRALHEGHASSASPQPSCPEG